MRKIRTTRFGRSKPPDVLFFARIVHSLVAYFLNHSTTETKMMMTISMADTEAIWDFIKLFFYMFGIPLIIVVVCLCFALGCIRRFCHEEPTNAGVLPPQDTWFVIPANDELGV